MKFEVMRNGKKEPTLGIVMQSFLPILTLFVKMYQKEKQRCLVTSLG